MEVSGMSGNDSNAETGAALRLWVILNRAVSSIEAVLEEQVARHDLSYTEFAVLEVLLHKGALPIGEVGDQVLLTSGSMTYVIDKLEDRELLHRRPCPEDRRVLYVELTEQGRLLIEEVFEEHAALLKRLTEVLTPEEIDRVSTLVKRFGKHAEGFTTEIKSKR
jgi:MarR family 2-MHQ and catechol resistance regulon transcriptional repressor